MEHEEHDTVDDLMAELQSEIDAVARRRYSATVLQHARNPDRFGRMPAPDAQAAVTGPCGDTMEMYLRLDERTIAAAAFVTDGCGPALASGNMLTTMITGMTLDEAGRIAPEDLLAALDGLPEESAHCAELAVSTLRQAIAAREGRDAPTSDRDG